MPRVKALGRYLLYVLDPAMAVDRRVAVKHATGVLKDRDGGRVVRLAEVEADDPIGLSWQKDRCDGHRDVVAHCHSGTTASVNAALMIALRNPASAASTNSSEYSSAKRCPPNSFNSSGRNSSLMRGHSLAGTRVRSHVSPPKVHASKNQPLG